MALEAGSGGTAPQRKPRDRKVVVKKGGDADRTTSKVDNVQSRQAPGRTGFAPQQQSGGPSIGDLARGAGREVAEFNRDVGEDILSIPKGIGQLVANLRHTDMEDVRNLPRDLVGEGRRMGEQFIENWNDPVRYADEHPGFFMLDLIGAAAPAGRLINKGRAANWASEAGELDIGAAWNQLLKRPTHSPTGELTPEGTLVRDILDQTSLGGGRQAARMSDEAEAAIMRRQAARRNLENEMSDFPGRGGGGVRDDPTFNTRTITRNQGSTAIPNWKRGENMPYEPGRPRGEFGNAQNVIEQEVRSGGPTDPYSMPYDESVSGLDDLLASRPPGRARKRDVQAESHLTDAQEAGVQDDFASWLNEQAPPRRPYEARGTAQGLVGWDENPNDFWYHYGDADAFESTARRGLDPDFAGRNGPAAAGVHFAPDPYTYRPIGDRPKYVYRTRRDRVNAQRRAEDDWYSEDLIPSEDLEAFMGPGEWKAVRELIQELPPGVRQTTLERLIDDLNARGTPQGQGRFVPSYSQRDPNRERFMNRRV